MRVPWRHETIINVRFCSYAGIYTNTTECVENKILPQEIFYTIIPSSMVALWPGTSACLLQPAGGAARCTAWLRIVRPPLSRDRSEERRIEERQGRGQWIRPGHRGWRLAWCCHCRWSPLPTGHHSVGGPAAPSPTTISTMVPFPLSRSGVGRGRGGSRRGRKGGEVVDG
jgi:hypothetical protein